MISTDLLSITVVKDVTGELCINVDCNNHDFDSHLLSDLIEKTLETATSIMNPTLH